MRGWTFIPPMVRATLDDRKHTTRRPIDGPYTYKHGQLTVAEKCPCRVGQQVYMKETYGFQPPSSADGQLSSIVYKATDPQREVRWRSPRFMRQVWSRGLLEIVEAHAEILTDITDEEALDEGIEYVFQIADRDWSKVTEPSLAIQDTPRDAYFALWNRLYYKQPWYHVRLHPPVWVYKFRLVLPAQGVV